LTELKNAVLSLPDIQGEDEDLVEARKLIADLFDKNPEHSPIVDNTHCMHLVAALPFPSLSLGSAG